MVAARVVGSALGVGAVVALLIAGRPSFQEPRLGARVVMRAASAGAVAVEAPAGGPVLAAASLRPGDPPLAGRVRLLNRSPRPIRVRLAAFRPGGPLDSDLAAALDLRVGRRGRLASGPIAAAADAPGIVLPGMGRRTVGLTLRLAGRGPDGDTFAGEVVSLVLVPRREVLR